ncbi:hypothetical protein [Gordonia zhaorongruii]|uniref:hypothetical protein n=1 Tax=Gordonia zhaorongruii TaxID=2597659 RepID=UPI0010534FB6|nr:hypothetical protein [Gordonia zhaorongruii]
MTHPPQADIRFHLPAGPPVRQATWRRRYRWPIRIGSIVVVLVLAALAITALVVGADERSQITARGAVTIDCGTRAATGTIPVSFGDQVQIFDAEAPDGPLASTRLNELRKLGGDTCLAAFVVEDLAVVDVYVVRIGDDYRKLVPAGALVSGYLFE